MKVDITKLLVENMQCQEVLLYMQTSTNPIVPVFIYSINKRTFERNLEYEYEFHSTNEVPRFTKKHSDELIVSLDISLESDLRSMYVVECDGTEY